MDSSHTTTRIHAREWYVCVCDRVSDNRWRRCNKDESELVIQKKIQCADLFTTETSCALGYNPSDVEVVHHARERPGGLEGLIQPGVWQRCHSRKLKFF